MLNKLLYYAKASILMIPELLKYIFSHTLIKITNLFCLLLHLLMGLQWDESTSPNRT